MIRLFILIAIIFSLSPPFAIGQDLSSFKATLDKLEGALLNQNFKIINTHLALESIIRNKIKRLSLRAEKSSSSLKRAVGKIADFSAVPVAKATTPLIMSQYKKSSYGLRKTYLQSLKFSKFEVKGDSASASGVFLGQPASVYAKKIKGEWVIVGAESSLIDAELKKILRLFK